MWYVGRGSSPRPDPLDDKGLPRGGWDMSGKVEPRDLGSLEKAVNDAASRAAAVWLSFIAFSTWLLVSVGTVSHRQLFLEEQLKLPILGVDLPFVGFFLAAPLFFLVFHFYTLLQLQSLAAKVAHYNV